MTFRYYEKPYIIFIQNIIFMQNQSTNRYFWSMLFYDCTRLLFIYALEFLIWLTFDVTQNYCIAYSMTIIYMNFEVWFIKLLI